MQLLRRWVSAPCLDQLPSETRPMSGGLPFPPPPVLPCCYPPPPPFLPAVAKVFAKLRVSPGAASELPPPPLHGEDRLVLCCAAASLRRTASPAWFGRTACCSCLQNLDATSTKLVHASDHSSTVLPLDWRSKVATRPRVVGLGSSNYGGWRQLCAAH